MKSEPAPTIPLPERTCGRCRRRFDGDPALYFQTDWGLCPECTAILLPKPHNTSVKSP
jgi:hypothetical protein